MRWALAFLIPLFSCAPYVHSPPGRTFPLESSKTLYPRETGIQFEGGGSVGSEVGLPGFTLRVRHGIVKHLDGSAEFNFQRINPDGGAEIVGSSSILGGRIGLKYAIVDHVAIMAGCGMGSWSGGGFVSPDLSLILAYENPYAVPFFSGGGYSSHPFRTQIVTIEDPGDPDFMGVPVLTWGWMASAGLRIPLGSYDAKDSTPPSFLFGLGFRGAIFDEGYDIGGVTSYSDGLRRELYFYGSVGFEYVFHAPKRRSYR